MRRNNGSIWFGILVTAVLLASIVAAKLSWGWLHPEDSTDVSNSETLRNVGLLIGGVLAFMFAGWRAWIAERQADAAQTQAGTAQRTLLNDQYQRGTDMLSSEVLAIRLAGIYALRAVAEQQPAGYHLQIMRLFCAFVKGPPKDDILDTPFVIGGEEIPLRIREDAQAALSAVGRRDPRHLQIESEEGFRVDLRGANLRNADFRRCLFDQSDLTWADLTGADLEDAKLAGADLTYADLSVAHMSGADFQGANCRLARISGAKAHDANFTAADLEGTILSSADLENACLSYATLRGADLTRAILSGTDISGTKFGTGGRRSEDYSEGELGISATQAYTSLTQEQFDQATASHDCPPEIEHGTNNSETGFQLVWKAQTAS